MKKIIFIILFSILFSCWGKVDKTHRADILCKKNNLITEEKDINKIYQSNQKISFNGKWEWKSKDSTSSFQLRIIQTGTELKAQYCAVQYSGNRMDCDFDTNYNIHGRVKDNKAFVKFTSFYGAKSGEAILSISEDRLIWKITKWPIGKDCFAPEEVELKIKI